MDYNTTDNFSDIELPQITYGGFWARFFASLIDGLILIPFVFPLTYYNMVSWKSPAVYLLISIVGLAYKPFCEFMYGATIGKKALNLKVVNQAYEKPSLVEILLRNIFNFIAGIVSLIFTLTLFSMPGFEQVANFTDYITFTAKMKSVNSINQFSGLHYVVDVVFLLIDPMKRTLHDRIGKTYVIKVA